MLQPAADFDQGPDRVPEPQEVAAQHVEPLDLRLGDRMREHVVLDLLDLLVNALEHGRVVVDDEIEDRIKDVVLAARERTRAALATLAYRRVGGRGAVANRHEIAVADEDMRLAEGDPALDQLRRARNDE